MAKTNESLLDDYTKRRKEVNKLKNELKTQQQAHERQLQEMRAEFEVVSILPYTTLWLAIYYVMVLDPFILC